MPHILFRRSRHITTRIFLLVFGLLGLTASTALGQSPTGGTVYQEWPPAYNVTLSFTLQPDGAYGFSAAGVVDDQWVQCGTGIPCGKHGRIWTTTDRKGRVRVAIKLARREKLVGVSYSYAAPSYGQTNDSVGFYRTMWDDGVTTLKRRFKFGMTVIEDGKPWWTELVNVNAMIYNPRFSPPPQKGGCDDVSCPGTMK